LENLVNSIQQARLKDNYAISPRSEKSLILSDSTKVIDCRNLDEREMNSTRGKKKSLPQSPTQHLGNKPTKKPLFENKNKSIIKLVENQGTPKFQSIRKQSVSNKNRNPDTGSGAGDTPERD